MNSRYRCIGAGGCPFRFPLWGLPWGVENASSIGECPRTPAWCSPQAHGVVWTSQTELVGSVCPPSCAICSVCRAVRFRERGTWLLPRLWVCRRLCIGTSSFSSSGLVLSVRWSDLLSFYSFVHVNTLTCVCVCVRARARVFSVFGDPPWVTLLEIYSAQQVSDSVHCIKAPSLDGSYLA